MERAAPGTILAGRCARPAIRIGAAPQRILHETSNGHAKKIEGKANSIVGHERRLGNVAVTPGDASASVGVRRALEARVADR